MMKTLEYAAPCARARGLKSRLLDSSDWQHLFGFEKLDEMAAWLYERGLISSDLLSLEEMEKELRVSTIGAVEAILRFTSKYDRKALRFSIYYFDILNVCTMCRNIHEDMESVPSDYIYDTGRNGLFKLDTVTSAKTFPMLDEIVQGTFMKRPFSDAFDDYKSDNDIARMTGALQHAFLKEWRGIEVGLQSSGSGRSIFKAYIAAIVLAVVMRMKFCRQSGEEDIRKWLELLITRRQADSLLEQVQEEDPASAFDALAKRLCGKDAQREEEDFDINRVDHYAKSILLQNIRRYQSRVVFSIDFLAGLCFLHMIEMENLIAVLESLSIGMASEDAHRYLVGVA